MGRIRQALGWLWLGGAVAVIPTVVQPASPPAGVWEGAFHGGRGDQTIALVLLPRGTSGLAGMMYLDGEEFGPVERARTGGDSLQFVAFNFPIAARIVGDRLECALRIPHGAAHAFVMRRVSADTLVVPPSVARAQTHAPATMAVPLAPDSVYRAHAVPPGSMSSVAPCLARGTLLLVGGGASQPEIVHRFVALCGGTGARVVDIPTGSMDLTAEQAAAHAAGLARSFGLAHVTALHTASRDTADSEAFVEPLEHATGVWIEGGEARALLHSYMGTRTERALIALLDRGGVIGGTSAGALIWGSRAMVFEAHPGMSQWRLMTPDNLAPADLHDTTIGALRNVLIAPHFTEFKLQPVAAKLAAADPGLLQIGIDQDTAVEVHGDVATVLGLETVSIYDGRQHEDGAPARVLRAGQRYDLVNRRVLP